MKNLLAAGRHRTHNLWIARSDALPIEIEPRPLSDPLYWVFMFCDILGVLAMERRSQP